MLYRYELYADGEYQGVGILQELDDAFSEEKANVLAQPFDEGLQVPPYHKFNGRPTVSFFTEEGRKQFKDSIAAVISAYGQESCFEVRELTTEEAAVNHAILWQDNLQVIVAEDVVCRTP